MARPYQLTLTFAERQAIDWVGNRYGHGSDLFDILMGSEYKSPNDGWGWLSSEPITFCLHEHEAWQIREIGEQSNFLWDCFSSDLVGKMNDFCDKIV